MKVIPNALVSLALALLAAELLIVPLELYVGNLSHWLGYGFVWSMSNFKKLGDIVIRWDIVSFEVCVTTTLAFVSYAIIPRQLRQTS